MAYIMIDAVAFVNNQFLHVKCKQSMGQFLEWKLELSLLSH